MISLRGGPAERVEASDPSAVARARRVGDRLAEAAGIDASRRPEWSIAVTEATSNVVRHGERGAVVLSARPGAVELWALDHGPGIADVRWSLADGSTTSGSAGLGLGAIQRQSDVFAVHTERGRGTVLYAGIGADPDLSGVVLACPGTSASGDGWSFVRSGSEVSALVFDGLGHGPAAARAAETALSAFEASAPADPAALLRGVGEALHAERGGVGSVVSLADGGPASFAGVGNVDARVVGMELGEQRLLPSPGTLGGRLRSLASSPLEAPMSPVYVLATDGIRPRWRARELSGVWGRSVGLVVGLLLWSFHRGNDDAAVLAFRPSAEARGPRG